MPRSIRSKILLVTLVVGALLTLAIVVIVQQQLKIAALANRGVAVAAIVTGVAPAQRQSRTFYQVDYEFIIKAQGLKVEGSSPLQRAGFENLSIGDRLTAVYDPQDLSNSGLLAWLQMRGKHP